jgi:hypothetical protein
MSGRALREFLRRHKPAGPHRICYHCDSVVPGPRCNGCHSDQHIAPCNGRCYQCIEETRKKVRPTRTGVIRRTPSRKRNGDRADARGPVQ